MTKKLLMGNEAFAHATLEAGVAVVAGYPGTPSSELIETVAKRVQAGAAENVHVEWSTNERRRSSCSPVHRMLAHARCSPASKSASTSRATRS